MIALILETIDKFSSYKSRRQFAHYAGEEAAGKWDDISSYLYLLLGKHMLAFAALTTVYFTEGKIRSSNAIILNTMHLEVKCCTHEVYCKMLYYFYLCSCHDQRQQSQLRPICPVISS